MSYHPELGSTETFNGAMASPITRNVKSIQIIETATFTVLDYMFSGGTVSPTPSSNVTGIQYSTEHRLEHVKKFQLASGIIKVTYYGA